MPNLTAYGYTELRDIFTRRVSSVDVMTMQNAVIMSVEEHTRQINNLLSTMVTRTTAYSARYQLASGGSLQPLDANGNPLPVRPTGSYDIAFPIQGAGTAWGNNRVSRALMTVEDANTYTMDAMLRDTDWMRRHVLATLFTNVTWTYADPERGNLVIQPLANGDAVTYVNKSGATATDTHFLAQAAAIADATNPYPTLYNELAEHPSNTGPYIAYIPTNLVATTTALASFIPTPDPDITYGSAVTRLTSPQFDPDVSAYNGGFLGLGDRTLGKVGGMWIVEWASLPDSYIVAHASGVNDVIGMREYDAPELQGFFPEFDNVDGNHNVSRMLRFAGFGIMNRTAAAIMRIGNAAYAIPANMTAPLAA